jgi:tetratricopeptide (TPR) repeat protein
MMEYGQKDEAIQEFQIAIKQNPEFHDAYRNLAWIYQGMHRYDDSIDWGMKSLKIKPLDRETYLLLGLNYLELHDWNKARHHFERAIELSPDYGRAHLYLGNVCQKTGGLAEAVRHYKTALKFIQDVNIYLDMGWTLILQQDLRGARESYESLIKFGKGEFLAFYFLGMIDLLEGANEKAMGRFESAASMCQKLLSGDPDNPYCLATLAQSLARTGRGPEALIQAARVGQLASGNGTLTLERARVHAILGDSAKSLELLKQSLTQPAGPSDFEIRTDPHFAHLDLAPILTAPSN